MRTQTTMQWVMGAALVLGQACAGGGTMTTSQAASALETVQCTFQADRAAADECFDAFRTCMDAAGADEASCRATLQRCLPPPPAEAPPDEARERPPPRDGQRGGGCGRHGDGDERISPRPPEPCFEAFETCVQAEGADEVSCRDALRACLPPPPTESAPSEDDQGRWTPTADRARDQAAEACLETFTTCLRAEGADQASCRQALYGCLPPPFPERGGDDDRHGGHGRPAVRPDSAEVQGCRDALDACLAAAPGEASCFEAERACMHAAFDAAFQTLCATVTCDAATDPDCERLVQRCTEGVAGRPEAFDGGTCQ
jgi:hypothetical protein